MVPRDAAYKGIDMSGSKELLEGMPMLDGPGFCPVSIASNAKQNSFCACRTTLQQMAARDCALAAARPCNIFHMLTQPVKLSKDTDCNI